MIGDESPETYVTEEIYEVLRINLASILAEKDDYLEVFLPDMAYSDEPIKKNISEDLADIYQDCLLYTSTTRKSLTAKSMADTIHRSRSEPL